MYHWDTKIRYVRGLGPTRSRELIKIGITTVGELLEYRPLSYIYPGAVPINEAKEGMIVIKAKVVEVKRGYGSMVVGVLEDETGACKVIWYCGAWAIQSLRPGWIATFWGKMKDGTLQNPKWTTSPNTIKGVYGGQYGVHHDTIRAALVEVLANVELPTVYEGDSRVATFQAYHFPKSKDEQGWALAVLKYDECLQLQLALQERRRGRDTVKGEVIWI